MSIAADQSTLSLEEQQIYDRQLRIWGVQAQARMRNSAILIIGRINGLAAEIAKNLTLSGVGSITLCDNVPVSELSLCSNFFINSQFSNGQFYDPSLTEGQATIEALQELNPNVHISHQHFPNNNPNAVFQMNDNDDNSSSSSHSEGFNFLNFSFILCIGTTISYANNINNVIRTQYANQNVTMTNNNNNFPAFVFASLDHKIGLSFFDLGDTFTWCHKPSDLMQLPHSSSSSSSSSSTITQPQSTSQISVKFCPLVNSLHRGQFVSSLIDSNVSINHFDIISFYNNVIMTDASLSRAERARVVKLVHIIRDVIQSTHQLTNTTNQQEEEKEEKQQQQQQQQQLPSHLTPPACLQQNAATTAEAKALLIRTISQGANEVTSQFQHLAFGLELTPECAIFGGVIAQEVLRCLQQQSQPISGGNWLLLDLFKASGSCESVKLFA